MFGIGPLEMLVVLAFTGVLGVPMSMPPLPPDPIVLRAAPEECLAYLGWAGNAPPSPQSKNRTELLLAEKEVQVFVDQLSTQVLGALRAKAQGKPETELLAQTLPGLLHTLFTRPAAIYLTQTSNAQPPPGAPGGINPAEAIAVRLRAALVVNVGREAPQVAEALAKLEQLFAANLNGKATLDETTIAGVKLKRLTSAPQAPAVLWGFKQDLFIFAVGADEAQNLLNRLQPQAKVAPWLAAVGQQLSVERPAVTSYVNVALALKMFTPVMDPKAGPILGSLGISKIRGYASVTGLTATGAVSKWMLATDGEPTGLLAMLPSKPLSLDDLKIVPRNATAAWAIRLNLADVYRQIQNLTAAIDPQARAQFDEGAAMLEQQLGLKPVDDVLAPLGDCWVLYVSPVAGGAPWAGAVLSATLADRAKFAKSHDQILNMAKAIMAAQGGEGQPTIVESTIGAVKVYELHLGGQVPVTPSWCISERHLVVAASSEALKAFLARQPSAESLADVKPLQSLLGRGGGPSIASYEDTLSMIQQAHAAVQTFGPLASGFLKQQGIDFTVPTLPTMAKISPYITPTISVTRRTTSGIYGERYYSVPLNLNSTATTGVLVGLLLPAVQSAREAARRAQSTNNLKQIALAMHNHAATNNDTFPAAAITSKDGKPLLSWRVQILPYLEEEALYKQFHLDEPWDSEHNRKLIERMPALYGSPDSPELAPTGKTRYLLPTGEAALFSGAKGPAFKDITDGTSNTIMSVEVAPDKAVIWTKPDDLKIDPKNPLDGLQGSRPGGFVAGFADGSVRILSNDIDPEMLRLLFNPRDGQAVDPGKF